MNATTDWLSEVRLIAHTLIATNVDDNSIANLETLDQVERLTDDQQLLYGVLRVLAWSSARLACLVAMQVTGRQDPRDTLIVLDEVFAQMKMHPG